MTIDHKNIGRYDQLLMQAAIPMEDNEALHQVEVQLELEIYLVLMLHFLLNMRPILCCILNLIVHDSHSPFMFYKLQVSLEFSFTSKLYFIHTLWPAEPAEVIRFYHRLNIDPSSLIVPTNDQVKPFVQTIPFQPIQVLSPRAQNTPLRVIVDLAIGPQVLSQNPPKSLVVLQAWTTYLALLVITWILFWRTGVRTLITLRMIRTRVEVEQPAIPSTTPVGSKFKPIYF
jgi:hypothetical protein